MEGVCLPGDEVPPYACCGCPIYFYGGSKKEFLQTTLQISCRCTSTER